MGSTPPTSTRWTLHEHLLFQRRLRREGVAVMSKQKSRVKVLMCLGPRFFIYLCRIGIWFPIIIDRPPQAMRVLIHTHLFCLLGTMPQTPLDAEFILRLRVLQTLLKGTSNCQLLCRDVANHYTLIISRATVKQRSPPADRWVGKTPPHRTPF